MNSNKPFNKKIIIFTGPSLNSQEAEKVIPAEYRPPIKRGDILSILNDSPDIIGIIDGVFHQQPAVSHREIMSALKKGIIVVGGSSMGALRASELDELGMKGIGYVYHQYKKGEIESDDDVAIVFNPQTYEQLSDALVSITFNFKQAEDQGIITKNELKILLDTAKSIFYPKRNYEKIFQESSLDLKTITNLRNFINTEGCDVKRKDALKVLEYIAKISHFSYK
ncbi:TfuA-related McrA-glycine thioamidation protein [Methanobacterium alcaliphilum]|uniref:TfuA-related McrA-glycine thioamidation protein n=1 Tax=Methanobacterium alcaliphilum TaxID=392018 RepID=UPI00200B16DD|nr:TfuA-related McrA-glycine thioamidation protein [Methanobacterium alcaliphilum]MCK9150347.1 TfuA-related McrA-glycine thioamidation protein [Methanobacterium alcaliphilum]